MTEREPEPKLREDEQTDGRLHVHMTRPRLKRDCHVTPASVDDPLSQDGTKLCDGVFVFVSDDFGVVLSVEGSLGRHELRVLDQDHS